MTSPAAASSPRRKDAGAALDPRQSSMRRIDCGGRGSSPEQSDASTLAALSGLSNRRLILPDAWSCPMPKPVDLTQLVAFPAAPDLAAAASRLASSSRLRAALCRCARSRLTAATPGNFSPFSRSVSARRPAISDFTDCAPGDLRAFLAHRRAEAIEGRSLQRALSALKSLARHIARESGQTAAALGAMRAPKAAGACPGR